MEFRIGFSRKNECPISIIIRFQQKNRQDLHNLNNGTFCRLSVVSAQPSIGIEKNPDAGLLLNYGDEYIQGYSQIKDTFRDLTKVDTLQPYKSDDDFRSSKAGVVDLGYNLFVFDIRY